MRGNVTRPQLMGGGQEGELVAGQPHHTGAPRHLGGEPIARVWGCRGSRKIYKVLKICIAKGKSSKCCIKQRNFCSTELLESCSACGHLFSAKFQAPALLVTCFLRPGVLDP